MQASADGAAPAQPTAAPEAFDPTAVAGLPDPVRRWLAHAITRGTPLRSSVELRMHGEIRLGAWQPFTAVQRLTPAGGFLWAATARVLRLPVTGFDRFTRGAGQMRWRLLNAIPVLAAEGEDITRSAAGRHARGAAARRPGGGAGLRHHLDASRLRSRRRHPSRGPRRARVMLTFAADGALTELEVRRWSNPGEEPFAEHVFGAAIHDEATVEGFTIPRTIVAGWHHGTQRWPDGRSFRYTIDHAHYR